MRSIIIALTILCMGQAFAGRTVNCTPEEARLAEEARDYILRNYQEVIPRPMNRLLGGTDEQLLNRYERKVQGQNIRCKDTKRFCSKVAGRSLGRIGNAIKICPSNLRGNFCTYVEIISH